MTVDTKSINNLMNACAFELYFCNSTRVAFDAWTLDHCLSAFFGLLGPLYKAIMPLKRFFEGTPLFFMKKSSRHLESVRQLT